MPLVDITVKRGLRLSRAPHYVSSRTGAKLSRLASRRLVRQLGKELPRMMINRLIPLGLTPDTPVHGVQVQHHRYGRHDVNPVGIWVKIHLSEPQPPADRLASVRNAYWLMILDWLDRQGTRADSLAVDLIWGPTNGAIRINGNYSEW